MNYTYRCSCCQNTQEHPSAIPEDGLCHACRAYRDVTKLNVKDDTEQSKWLEGIIREVTAEIQDCSTQQGIDFRVDRAIKKLWKVFQEKQSEKMSEHHCCNVIRSVPYQSCPHCNGSGFDWNGSAIMSCTVCHGKKIIPMAYCV
jgi:hypothetical protein